MKCETCENCSDCGCQASYDRAAKLWRIDEKCNKNNCANNACYCRVPAHVPPMGGTETLRNISCETPGAPDEWDLLLAFGAPGATFNQEECVILHRPEDDKNDDMIMDPLGLETSRFSVKIKYFAVAQTTVAVPLTPRPEIKVRIKSDGFDETVGFKKGVPETVSFGHWSLEITYN